jgi:plastocyanin
MRRALIAGVLSGLLSALGVAPAYAGGGGCRGTGVTTGTGVSVEIKGACFTPTMLRIAVGKTVTWVNRDDMTHNIIGSGFFLSSPDLNLGEGFRFTFARAGVYPYACYYHPGMVGAVIVGDASGPGPAGATAPPVDPGRKLVPEPAAVPTLDAAPLSEPEPAPSSDAGWIGLAIGLGVVGTATGFGIGRTRKPGA